MIYRKIKNEKISSFIDLGCRNGRVLYFFNKKLNIKLFGVELFKNSYNYCSNIFKNSKNITIVNKNFFDLNFNLLKFDCYFLNDPLKRLEDHNNLINSILSSHRLNNTNAMFVLVNLAKGKSDVFKDLELVFCYSKSSRNILIYKTKNK